MVSKTHNQLANESNQSLTQELFMGFKDVAGNQFHIFRIISHFIQLESQVIQKWSVQSRYTKRAILCDVANCRNRTVWISFVSNQGEGIVAGLKEWNPINVQRFMVAVNFVERFCQLEYDLVVGEIQRQTFVAQWKGCCDWDAHSAHLLILIFGIWLLKVFRPDAAV